MKLLKNLSILTLTAAISYGCSSSDSGTTATPSPNNIYSGTITGGATALNGIEEKGIFYNNRLLVLSRKADGIDQLFDINLTTTNLSLTGTGTVYDGSSIFLTNLDYDGSFVDNISTTLNFTDAGTISYPPGTLNLITSTTLMTKGSATSKLIGSWSGGFGGGFFGQMNLTIDATGTITAGGDQAPLDCVFTGTITPADTNINVYNAAITSDGGTALNCTMPAGAYTGLAWTEGDTDGTLVLMFADGLKGRAVILTRN
ncbi:MAG: hypothetical protein QM500_05625 [Methylococcales bacterium]